MVRCFVFGCRSNALRIKGCKIKYFSFPKNMRLAKLWREACGRKKSSKNARICSQHFSASSFKSLSQQDLRKNTSTSLRTLKVDAIPTLHLPKIIYVQKSKKLPALKNKSTESVAICENVGGENISDGNEKHLNLEQSSIEKIAVDAFEKGMESEVNFEENEILESVTALMEGVELGKVCRACLGTEGPMKNMFVPQKQTLISSYSHVLSICIGLQVDPDPGFPALLCSPCCSFLESYSSFRKQARCVSACLSKMCRKGCAVKNEESNTKKPRTADDSQTEACGEEGFVLLVGDDSSLATGFENYFKIDDGVASAQIRNKANVKKEITSEDGVKEESACEDAVGDHEDAGETKKEAVDDYESGDESWNEGDDAEVTAKTKRATLRGAIKAVTFPCRKCERHFLSWPELSEHNQSHDQATATADSVCRYCQITFRHPRFVYSHIVKVHPDEDRFQCGHCDVRFSSHKLLRIHMHRHQDTQPPEEAETKHIVSEKEELDTYNDSDSNDQVLAYIKKQNDTNKGLLQLRDKTKVFQDKIAEKKSKTGKKSTRVACSLCDKVFRQTALSRHMATHDPDKPFYCKVGRCKWSFSTEHDLAVHGMVNHSDPAEDASLVCLFCRKAFSGRRNLRQHMLQHKPSKRFNCSFCAKGFNFIHHLQNHERIHTREQPFLCTECGLAFTTSDGLASHTRNKHIWEKPLTCEHCQKKFADKTRLRIHMETHNNSDKFMCSECGKIFNKSSNLKKHVSNVHQRCLQNNRQRYSCDVCGDVSHNMQQLSRHMAVHTCKYFCHHCLKSFSIPSALDKHLKSHFEGDRSHVCNVCGAAFNRPDHLRGHTSRLHSAGSRPLSCAHCGRGFVRAQDLAEHTRIHTGEKPFKCKVCGKSYARGRALKIHERAHTGELPYICGVCHAGYKCAPGLASHMLTHSTPITHMNEIEGEDTKDFERSTSSIHISYTEVA